MRSQRQEVARFTPFANSGRFALAWLLPVAAALFVPASGVHAQAANAKPQAAGIMLEIAAEIRAQPGTETPMPVQVYPWAGMPRQVIILIRGLPANAVLSEGREFGPGVWAVPAAGAGNLRIVPLAGTGGLSEITVALVTPDGATLAEVKSVLNTGSQEQGAGRQENTAALTAVPLKAAPRAAGATGTVMKPALLTPEDEERLHKLIQKGDESMKVGKVSGARLFYRHAAESGSAPAALALGGTYDVNELSRLNVAGGVQTDATAARQWYIKARELGATDANGRLQRLGEQ